MKKPTPEHALFWLTSCARGEQKPILDDDCLTMRNIVRNRIKELERQNADLQANNTKLVLKNRVLMKPLKRLAAWSRGAEGCNCARFHAQNALDELKGFE